MTDNSIAKLVFKEIERLGMEDTETNASGLGAYADGDLPYGWVRVDGDNSGEVIYADGAALLSAFEEIEETDDSDANMDLFYEVVMKEEFYCRKPESTRDWPENLYSVEQIEPGTPNDDPLSVVTVATNAGIRYVAGPHGVSQCALEDWIRNGLDFAESRESALAIHAESV